MRSLHAALAALLLCSLAAAQGAENDKIWSDFMDWAKTQSGGLVIANYRARLIANGLPAAEAEQRIALIPKLYSQNSEYRQQMEALTFNKTFRDPNQTTFNTEPSAFLVSVTKALKPGTALDVAMGQGRNAVYLASKGWEVTGFDIAEDGLKLANQNASKASVRITTTKARIEDFDYGKERWDLICLIYVNVPFVDPTFIARIKDALKPGGVVLIDQPFRSLTAPEPGWPETEQDKPGALPKAWAEFKVLSYEDTTGTADWQQTATPRLEYKARIVHMLARKP